MAYIHRFWFTSFGHLYFCVVTEMLLFTFLSAVLSISHFQNEAICSINTQERYQMSLNENTLTYQKMYMGNAYKKYQLRTQSSFIYIYGHSPIPSFLLLSSTFAIRIGIVTLKLKKIAWTLHRNFISDSYVDRKYHVASSLSQF